MIAARLAQLEAQARGWLADDRQQGVLPPTARTWAALHQYVDANEYLPLDATPAECAAIVDRLEAWLRWIEGEGA